MNRRKKEPLQDQVERGKKDKDVCLTLGTKKSDEVQGNKGKEPRYAQSTVERSRGRGYRGRISKAVLYSIIK